MSEQLHDFRNFLWVVWKHLGLPDPTPVQYDIAEYLQNGPKRAMVEAFRGVGKSWITSAFVLHQLLMDPEKKILVVSASKERSDAFSIFTKRLLGDLPLLAHLKPREGQRDSNIAFDVGPCKPAHAPSVKSVGITGQITGSRADIIVADDIEVANNSLTQLQRDKLAEAVKEFDAVLSPKPESRILYLGTPQTEMSVYNRLPERGYDVRIWPAKVPTPEKVIKYEGRLAPFIMDLIAKGTPEGTPVDPMRFNLLDLDEREASYGRSGFALQFQLDTSISDSERYPLKLSDFIVFDINPEVAPTRLVWGSGPDQVINDMPNVGLSGDCWNKPMWVSPDFTEYTGSLMFIDPAGRGADEVGWVVVKHLHGLLFLLDGGGLRGGYIEENLRFLAEKARDLKVNLVQVESNFGDGMFTELLKPVLNEVYPVGVEEIRHSGQKELRIIDTLEPVLNQHRLVIDRKLILKDLKTDNIHNQLLYQLTRITKDRGSLRHDDRLDALAGGVGYWVASMAKDTQRAVDEHKTRQLERELEKFHEGVLGKAFGKQRETWIRDPWA
jgi:hypothetical protein